MNRDALVLSHFSLRDVSFPERIAVAAGAGFAGIGVYASDYRRWIADGAVPRDLRQQADDAGMRILELEVLAGWATPSPGERAVATERLLFELADTFEARHVHVIGPFDGTTADAAAAFAALCDRAAEHGLLVGIEPQPLNNLDRVSVALEIAELAGRANGGLCVDTWHHFRGDADVAQLAAIPAGRLVSIQINDGTLAPQHDDYFTDTITNRRAPGDGEFDLASVLAVLDAKQADVPVSVEVLSAELAALPPDVVAERLATATRTVLRSIPCPSS